MIPRQRRLCYSIYYYMGIKRTLLSLVLAVVPMAGVAGLAAAQSTSPNYRVDEYYFGTGGELDASSQNYRAKQSAGELGVGNTKSSSYQAQVGFNTTDVPMLEVAVNGDVDFGILDTETTAIGTANIQVRTYLASGYNMIIAGPAPTYAGKALNSPSMPTAAQPGTEQFGINLVDNSSPNIGTNPEQVPDNTFSFGLPTANYITPNEFMYQDGDTVAHSNSSSGQTNYTLSMIANMSNATPAGRYTTGLSVVVVAAF